MIPRYRLLILDFHITGKYVTYDLKKLFFGPNNGTKLYLFGMISSVVENEISE